MNDSLNKITLNLEKITIFKSISQYDFTNNKNININYQLINEFLNNKNTLEEFLSILYNKKIKIIDIYLANSKNPILSINKISFLNAILDFIQEEEFTNIEIIKKIYLAVFKLNYENIPDKQESYTLKIDGEDITIPVHYFYDFLTLEDNLYDLFISLNEKYYRGIEIEKFIYSLINYLESNHYLEDYVFPKDIIKRYLDLKDMQIIDYESINKFQETEDPYLKDVKINPELEKLLFNKIEPDKLKFIINTYLKLCKIFTYDDFYYIDPLSDDGMKHTKISYLESINEDNNKIVCFEFTAIFGYFLSKIKLPYKVIQNKSEYGYLHNYIVFRYEKFLICVDPISTILGSDLTTVKIGTTLVGITCLNKNNNTREEFQNILNNCYKSKKIETENEYLPANKIDSNNLELSPKIKDYIQRIDVILKKINQLELPIVDKLSYFRALMKLVFTSSELQINVSECVIVENSNPKKLIFVITLNEVSYMNLDNYYLIYDDDLRFIDRKDLQELFNNNTYEYLNEKHIPGIKEKSFK